MELNERLAQLRKEHGLSQNDLADQLKVSRQAVSRWEQGLAMPSSDNLHAQINQIITGIGYAVQ